MTTRRQEPPVNEHGSRRKKRRAPPLRKPPVQSQDGRDTVHSKPDTYLPVQDERSLPIVSIGVVHTWDEEQVRVDPHKPSAECEKGDDAGLEIEVAIAPRLLDLRALVAAHAPT